MTEPVFFIPVMGYFKEENPYLGSFGLFRFRLLPNKENETLELAAWKGPYCFEKSKPFATAEIPLDQEFQTSAKQWLTEQYHAMP